MKLAGGLHGVFLGLLDNSEVEEKGENGDVVRRRLEEEPEWGIKSPLGIWADQLKNNGIQVFVDKTAALIKDLQLTSCEKEREEISFLVGGWGIERYIIHALCESNWRTGFAVA